MRFVLIYLRNVIAIAFGELYLYLDWLIKARLVKIETSI